MNTLRASVAEVLAALQREGFTQLAFSELLAHTCTAPWSNAALVAVDPDACDGTCAPPPLCA